MHSEGCNTAAAVTKFQQLSAADRRAVLDQLDDPGPVLKAIEREARWSREATERKRRAGRQFEGYSPWLAHLIEKALLNESDLAEGLTNTASAKLIEIHRVLGKDYTEPNDSFTLRAIFRQILDFGKAAPRIDP